MLLQLMKLRLETIPETTSDFVVYQDLIKGPIPVVQEILEMS